MDTLVKTIPCPNAADPCVQCRADCPERAAMAEALTATDSRRGVVRRAILGVAGLGLVGLTAGCGNDDRSDGAEVTVPGADVPPVDGAPYRSSAGKFYLVRNGDGVLAFSWRCTHQGCEVPWREDEERFHCPCHDSIFDRNGVLVDGPAPRPLDLVRVEVRDNGDVAVKPHDKTERTDYDADQAVPYRT